MAYVTGTTGRPECPHDAMTWYHSGMRENDDGNGGTYAVCERCGLHVWNASPPEGTEVVDLDNFDDDYPEDEEEETADRVITPGDLDRWEASTADWSKRPDGLP